MKAAMKSSMKMKSMKMKSKYGSRTSVFHGTKAKTKSGLTKSDFVRNKQGKIVSKKASAAAKKKKAYKGIVARGKATKQARKDLGITGFCPVGGKTAQGKALAK